MINLLKEGNTFNTNIQQYLLDSIEDIPSIPWSAPVGSTAIILNETEFLTKMKKRQNVWADIDSGVEIPVEPPKPIEPEVPIGPKVFRYEVSPKTFLDLMCAEPLESKDYFNEYVYGQSSELTLFTPLYNELTKKNNTISFKIVTTSGKEKNFILKKYIEQIEETNSLFIIDYEFEASDNLEKAHFVVWFEKK